jgi:hypothetical protein
MNKIAIDTTRAINPPSLFGIDRRIAYANRKYHSGWMCTGVTNGFHFNHCCHHKELFALKYFCYYEERLTEPSVTFPRSACLQNLFLMVIVSKIHFLLSASFICATNRSAATTLSIPTSSDWWSSGAFTLILCCALTKKEIKRNGYFVSYNIFDRHCG